MRRTLISTACVAAAAAMALTPSWAAAAPGSVTDDTSADFQAGTTGTATQVVAPGSVQLAPELAREQFAGSALPAGMSVHAWNDGGGATVADDALAVDGARVQDDTSGPADHSLEFRATFSNAPFEHVGYGVDFNDAPWAMFSTGGGALTVGLYARTWSASSATADNFAIADVDPTQPHTYRIEWAPAEVRYFVDGALVHTATVTITGNLVPIASDYDVGGGSVSVDWLDREQYPATGTFVSRVLDAGDARAAWGNLAAQGSTGVTFATRSGNTATPDASWSDFADVGPAGEIKSPMGRYLQYRATLNSTGPTTTPTLERVDAAFDVDTIAPAAAIDGIAVTGTSAKLTFSSGDSDVARFECSLDGGSFATCTSPREFTGLGAGAHTVAVRAVDTSGNAGTAVSQSFTVQAPAQQGGGTPTPTPPAPSGGGVLGASQDHTAPIVRIKPARVRASRTGLVRLIATCPSDEKSCAVTVRIKHGGRLLAHKTITVAGGKSRVMRLRLTRSARHQLAHARHIRVSGRVTARDAAGNAKTRTIRIKLLAPSR